MFSKPSNSQPIDFEAAGITENIGAQVPLDIELTDSTGATLNTNDLFSDGKPVVLVMAYYSCPMLCNLVVESVADVVNKTQSTIGERYRIVTISFDPRDTTASAAAFAQKHIASVKTKVRPNGWRFLIGNEGHVRTIGDAVGFKYKYLPETNDYAHGAGIIILTPDGKVSRYIYGVEYNPRDFRLALLEASNRKYVSTIDKVTLYCYAYNSKSKGYSLVAMNIMKLGGLATVIVIATLIIGLNIKNKDQKKQYGK